MNIKVVIEQRFYICRNGIYWTPNAFGYDFWLRYLTVFKTVTIVARVKYICDPLPLWHKVTGEGVDVYPLPFYLGPFQFLTKLPLTILRILKLKKSPGAVIYRIPGVISFLHQLITFPLGGVYGAEVVGDPEDVFTKKASRHILRPLLKKFFIKALQFQCGNATSISYVTRRALQIKYPPKNGAFSTNYSSIKLHENDYNVRKTYAISNIVNLVCIGNLSQPYKGCDFMLQALVELRKSGIDFHLTWIGGGALLDAMEGLAVQYGIEHAVKFTGNIASRDLIFNALDSADIFLLPSRQEGLPRALIEAMARSTLCVANDVGGVNELLGRDCIAQPENMDDFINKVLKLVKMDERDRLVISARNFTIACEYSDSKLGLKRYEMYSFLKENVCE